MKIDGVDFPEPLLNALRDGHLVVFAGAGVSMGPSAGLPSFSQLAEQVAEGTGQSIDNAETEDRFLGRLKGHGTNVHQRSAQILQRNNLEPNALHLNLLRLFNKQKDMRIVTTNFDNLFEQAALSHLNSQPKVFQAPALPLGNRFQGIVHLHGSVNEPKDMVLTHQDFGRAYLTEADGWARRFLVDLFVRYTVLFVGYSHSDMIMTYLTPSLPLDGGQKRFALSGGQSNDLDHWRRMSIEPVTFHQADANDFSGLDAAVAKLANFLRRGVLDWQHKIAAVASGKPPIDDNGASVIEHALTTPELTSFFVEAAETPEWIDWLDHRGHLDRLFTDGDLEDQHAKLSCWLARRFAAKHSNELFSVILRHRRRLNSHLWNQLAWQIHKTDDAPLGTQTVSRWVHFLMSCIPPHTDDSVLLGLVETCAKVGAFHNLLQVYDAMMAPRNQLRPGDQWDAAENQQYWTQIFWKECLEPHLPHIVHSLLERTTMRLEERHSAVMAWNEDSKSWDKDSCRRSAIEPHEQDSIPHSIDALINAARDCLEWLTTNDPVIAGAWCDRFIGSDAPLLRRLAIHAMAARNDLSADDKIVWLLERCNVNEINARHEIFRAVARVYPQAGPQQRTALIQAVSECQAPESKHYDNDNVSADHHFSWFHWLHTADPDCGIVKGALAAVWTQHPEFVPAEHPDFIHWPQADWVTHPWPADTLQTKPAVEVLPDLLAYQPTDQQRFDGYDRWAMLRAVEESVRTNLSWGLDLADAMVGIGAWDSDLWYHVIIAWAKAELDDDSVRRVLLHLSAGELHRQHAREIAEVLSELVRKTNGARADGLPHEANSIAIALHPYATVSERLQVPQCTSWLTNAINHASGQLALFWIRSIALWSKQQEIGPQSLNVEYRNALNAIVRVDGIPGKFGRTVLASQFHFFFAVDEAWALDNLLPLFDTNHDDFQCAWDGFLSWGRLSPPIAEHLREKSINAVQRIIQAFDECMLMRFVEFYVAALGWLIDGANDDLITEFFKQADAKAKSQFAIAIKRRLRDLDEVKQKEWWDIWLRDYWENRLQGVPSPLDDAEIAQMLEWVMHLPGVFPEAVNVATRMCPIPITKSLALYNISESDLIKHYPNELAQLLVHFGQCDAQPWFWHGTREAVDRLLEKGLLPDLDMGLRELIVKHHQWMGG